MRVPLRPDILRFSQWALPIIGPFSDPSCCGDFRLLRVTCGNAWLGLLVPCSRQLPCAIGTEIWVGERGEEGQASACSLAPCAVVLLSVVVFLSAMHQINSSDNISTPCYKPYP